MSTVLDQIAQWSLLGAFLDSNLSDCTVASHLHLCWGSSEKMQLCFHQGSKTKPPFAQQSKESNHKSLFSGGSKFLPTWYRCKQRFQLGRMIEMSRDRLHPMHAEQWNYLVALHPATVCNALEQCSALLFILMFHWVATKSLPSLPCNDNNLTNFSKTLHHTEEPARVTR